MHTWRLASRRSFNISRSLSAQINKQIHRQFNNRCFHFVFLTALSLAIIFAKLHEGDLKGFDEAIYAHEGKTMLMTGDWWNIRLNGRPDYDKPPLFIWLEAISMLIFGISDFAARIPSAVFGLGTLTLIYFLARELSDDFWLPVLSMVVMICTPDFMRLSMHAMTDVPFTFFFTLAIYLYIKALKEPRFLLFCGLAIASTIMLRSILGVIPLVIITLHILTIRQTRLLFSKYFLGCFHIALGLPMIWFVSQYFQHGEQFLVLHFSYSNENLPRVEGKGVIQIFIGLLHYPLMLLKTYWPWLPFVVIGFWIQLKRALAGKDFLASLLVIWVLSVMLPFSLVETKALRYILAAFPAFSILAAISLSRSIPAKRKILFVKMAYAVMICLSSILAFVPKHPSRMEEMRSLAPLVEIAIPPEQRVMLYISNSRRWAFLSQVIWYSNRQCELLDDLGKVISHFKETTEAAVILERQSFAQTVNHLNHLNVEIEILGQSKNFICIAKKRAVEAKNDLPSVKAATDQ